MSEQMWWTQVVQGDDHEIVANPAANCAASPTASAVKLLEPRY